jgi:hypothetical protein
MKKTFVGIILSTMFLFTCGALAVVGNGAISHLRGGVPRPPFCPPDTVCNPSANLLLLDTAILRLRDGAPRPPLCPPDATCPPNR